MGLTVTLEDERGVVLGAAVEDPKNLLYGLLPHEDDVSYELLRYIDPYGDTTFNQLQIGAFLDEWARVRERATTEEQYAIVDAIEALARECLSGVHKYLKFVGD